MAKTRHNIYFDDDQWEKLTEISKKERVLEGNTAKAIRVATDMLLDYYKKNKRLPDL